MDKKIYAIIAGGLILGSIGTGIFIWQREQNEKIEESKSEVASLENRVITPTTQTTTEQDNTKIATDILEENTVPNETITDGNLPAPEPLPSPEQTPTDPIENKPLIITTNQFTGIGSYKASGTSSILETNGQVSLNFENNFEFSGAPDAVVYMCQEQVPSSIDNCLIISALTSNIGAQAYAITKEEFDMYPHPIIWCRAFSLLMAHSI